MLKTESRARRSAWIGIVVADVGLFVWGALAALVPHHLSGPKSASILKDGYEGFTGLAWSQLVAASPGTSDYIELVFRMYGIFCALTALLATIIAAIPFRRGERWAWWTLLLANTLGYGVPMAYDQIVGAIGPFELTEYLGLAVVYAALAITRPARGRGPRRGEAPRPGSSPRSLSSDGACAS